MLPRSLFTQVSAQKPSSGSFSFYISAKRPPIQVKPVMIGILNKGQREVTMNRIDIPPEAQPSPFAIHLPSSRHLSLFMLLLSLSLSSRR